VSPVETPKLLKKREFGDPTYYFKWPKVADAVIEAHFQRLRFLFAKLHASEANLNYTIGNPIRVVHFFYCAWRQQSLFIEPGR